MLGDEAAVQVMNITVRGTETLARAVFAAIRFAVERRNTIVHGAQSMRKLNLQAMHNNLDAVDISGQDMKSIRRELKKMKVDFAVYKDKGQPDAFKIFFKGTDYSRIELALKTCLSKMDGKMPDQQEKASVRQKMDDAVKKAAQQNQTVHARKQAKGAR